MNDAKQVFLDALDRETPEEQTAFLDEICAGDSELRTRVDELLRAHREAGNFLGGARLVDAESTLAPGEMLGAMIGSYKLLEQIGEGGFGVVYAAEQQHPVRRRVALKVVKPGMDTREVIARFEAERQALAIMDHPNIAHVLDAGTTDSGRPYFVMELVHGVSITEFCDQHALPPRERLEIFLTVCQAVQHAHQKGIIHRDIKPSNVLVTSHDGRPVAKVIDFGVAKAISGQLVGQAVYTRFAQMIGTPLYMSPEHAEMSGLDIDTRTDIYSLGVLLYELLTGTTPFDRTRLGNAALDEIRRIIREEEPPKPSTRLSDSGDSLPSIAANRHTEPARLTKLVRGDLDWIVMKALEKDRQRRYESANGLASDVQRYLADEPVEACPPSRVYRIGKFVRRNKYVAFTSAAILASLIVGLIGTTIGLIGQSRQRAIAEDAREQLQAVNDFLMYDVFAGVETDRTPDKAVRDQIVKAMIDPAAATVAKRFQGKPIVEAKVRHALAMSYESVGRSDLGIPHARKALEINLRELGPNHPDTIMSTELLGALLRSLGQNTEAEPLLRESLAAQRLLSGDDDELTIIAMNNLATLLQSQGDFAQAESLYREAMVNSQKAFGVDDEYTLLAMNNLGHALRAQGRLAEAEKLLPESLERCRRVLGENNRGTLQAIGNMGSLRMTQGKLDEAEQYWREGMEGCLRVLGPDDPETLHAVSDYAGVLMELGRFDDAEPLVRDTLLRRQRVLSADHPDSLVSLTNLGLFLRRKGDLAAAEPLMREAVERSRHVKGDDHPDTLVAMSNLGSLLLAQDRLEEAGPYFVEAWEGAQRVLKDDHPLKVRTIYELGVYRFRQKKLNEAEPLLLDALDRRRALFGDDHLDTLYVMDNLGSLRREQGLLDQAEKLFRDVLAGYQQELSNPDHWQIGDAHADLGIVLTMLKRHAEAEVELIEAERILGTASESHARRLGRCLEALITLYRAWEMAEPGHGHGEKAQAWQAKFDDLFLPVPPPDANAAD